MSTEPPCSDMLSQGYGKAGNFPTLKYIVLCHYTWRWLLSSNSKVSTRRLCLLAKGNIDYFGCDYRMYYFMCVKGFTFCSVVVGRFRWLDMEGPCVQLCTMSSSHCGCSNGPILSCGSS